MKVKDQIRVRREQLGISVNQLAKSVGVSSQSIRHWEAGRSFPGKSRLAALESALSITIDWTEGTRAAPGRKGISALIDQGDIDLLLLICRLPAPAKALIGDLVRMHVAALDGGRKVAPERISEGPVTSFHHNETVPSPRKSHDRKQIAGQRSAPKDRSTRRKAA